MGCGASSRASNPSPQSITNPRAQFDVNNMFVRTQALTAPAPYRHGTPITHGQLKHQREEFWTTRIGGNTIMWQALQTACEAMIVGDFMLANAIVEASCITTPTGTLDTCYDETGYMYKLPQYLWSNPVELTDNGPVSLPSPSQTDGSKGQDNGNDPEQERDRGNSVKLKVRINPGDVTLMVAVHANDSVAHLKRAIMQQSLEAHEKSPGAPVCEESRQRIMFMGKELQNNHLISQVGVDDGRIVQVFVRPAASTSTTSLASAATS